ncbi:MAG: ABC transporter permease [Spirochaetes bacterium]|nr:ABC transporter permease [Spirochaetota bacterium]
MDLVVQGIVRAAGLLASGDREILEITLLSLRVSGGATLISTVIGVTLGAAVALNRFPGRNIAVSLINTGMGLPPVVVGLWVTLFIWRSGPLGDLGLLYTPTAIVVAQVVIAAPIVTGISLAAMQNIPEKLRFQILSLGAGRARYLALLVREARLPLLAGVMAGFGGALSEVGASIMVGGNIRGYTRVLTTATVMETGMGNFEVAIALGFVLLVVAFIINYVLTSIQQRIRS